MINNIEMMFANAGDMIKHLKKKSYEKKMEQFLNEYGHFIQEMIEQVETAEDKEKAAHEIGAFMASSVAEKYAVGAKKKIPACVQSDLNFFMIYFVFPAILKTECGEKNLIADSICKEWNACFKCSIGYTDYDTLYDSFREKIFGIF